MVFEMEGFVLKVMFGNLAETIREGMNQLKQFCCYSVQGYFFSVTRSRLKSSCSISVSDSASPRLQAAFS